MIKPRTNDRRAARGRRGLAAGALVLATTLGGCDGILEVDLPGQILEEDLDDPRLAAVLVRGAESDFECAYNGFVTMSGLWTSDFFFTDQQLAPQQVNQRSPAVLEFPEGGCGGNSVWLPFNVSRVQGESVIDRIENDWAPEAVQDREYLLAKAHAYTGYSYLVLGEVMCSVAFSGGPQESSSVALTRAVTHLESALTHAQMASHSDASSIANMARVGLARAHLRLGNDSEVLTNATAVPVGFARNITASSSTGRRENDVYDVNRPGSEYSYSVNENHFGLLVEGSPDPRVPVVDEGGAIAFDALTPIYTQLKYQSRDAPIPFATWREAQLMIAEVDPGQTEGIINLLRSDSSGLPAGIDAGAWPLPAYPGGTPAEIAATLVVERERELWLQGARLGDMLRRGTTFPTGLLPRGSSYGPLTCIPLPDEEALANNNFSVVERAITIY